MARTQISCVIYSSKISFDGSSWLSHAAPLSPYPLQNKLYDTRPLKKKYSRSWQDDGVIVATTRCAVSQYPLRAHTRPPPSNKGPLTLAACKSHTFEEKRKAPPPLPGLRSVSLAVAVLVDPILSQGCGAVVGRAGRENKRKANEMKEKERKRRLNESVRGGNG